MKARGSGTPCAAAASAGQGLDGRGRSRAVWSWSAFRGPARPGYSHTRRGLTGPRAQAAHLGIAEVHCVGIGGSEQTCPLPADHQRRAQQRADFGCARQEVLKCLGQRVELGFLNDHRPVDAREIFQRPASGRGQRVLRPERGGQQPFGLLFLPRRSTGSTTQVIRPRTVEAAQDREDLLVVGPFQGRRWPGRALRFGQHCGLTNRRAFDGRGVWRSVSASRIFPRKQRPFRGYRKNGADHPGCRDQGMTIWSQCPVRAGVRECLSHGLFSDRESPPRRVAQRSDASSALPRNGVTTARAALDQ